MKINEFVDALKQINIQVTDKQLELLDKYASFLIEYNNHTNLTAIKDIEGIYLKHFYDSILVSKYFNFSNVHNLIDIGTGAGFPGVVLKIFYPNIDVTLLDSNNKKTKFLNELIERLQLENITVINDRSENYVKNNRHKFDLVIARAVSELRIICELCLPLTRINGHFIAMKANYQNEMSSINNLTKILNSEIENIYETKLPVENSLRSFIIFKVNKEIDIKYPRMYDQIIKKELK